MWFRRSKKQVPPSSDNDMDAFVEKLRKGYDLEDPVDLSPKELKQFRKETQGVRDAVVSGTGIGLAPNRKNKKKRP